jgi:hypothetical protein
VCVAAVRSGRREQESKEVLEGCLQESFRRAAREPSLLDLFTWPIKPSLQV